MSSSHEIESNNPLELFDTYLQQAQQTEPNDANAAALATVAADGAPSVRMVLAKQVREHRFCFFTNAESRKGLELAENPRAALCFHWKSLRLQVRVEGSVSELDAQDVDTYFHSRARASQIGAAVSNQSRVLTSREELEERVRKFTEAHPGEIPRPAYWRGYCLHPQRIEFWFNGPDRLHDRFLFTRQADGWQKARLYP
ncbi:pyridoxamine 5'-phosphate oxidase [Acidicapsa acidisoli]|uniref:pyridoxamine 5'-phosphate oxidase n=1 Tax=Acidicapsa acidisoli TaxID=1615681 RepID=UPI0021E084EF|nr:pyridoxamine 5'-phosphate oxidase [Acidicapsa acidisoli]